MKLKPLVLVVASEDLKKQTCQTKKERKGTRNSIEEVTYAIA